MKSYENLGNMVYFLRRKRGITQGELSEWTRLPQSGVANIERGKARTYSLSRLRKVLYTLSVSEQSLQDHDLYELLPEGLRSDAAKAVSAALDAQFGCLTQQNSQLIIEKAGTMGLETDDAASSYVPASVVLSMIDKAFEGRMDDFFKLGLTRGSEGASREILPGEIEKGLKHSIASYFDVVERAATRGAFHPISKQMLSVKDYIDDIVEFEANDPFSRLVDRLDIRVPKLLGLYSYIRNRSDGLKRWPPERLLGALHEFSNELKYILDNLPKP